MMLVLTMYTFQSTREDLVTFSHFTDVKTEQFAQG